MVGVSELTIMPVATVTVVVLLPVAAVTIVLLVTIAKLVEEMIVVTDVVGGADKHLASNGRSDSNIPTGISDW